MLEASKILKATELPITHIALEVGYKNQSTFNKVFKERYGMTPKEYRLQNQNAEKLNIIF